MDDSQERRGRSSPIDFAGWIDETPEAKRAADDAEIAASVGELVRRLRHKQGMTQAELARRTGTTQAHISELERGLGANGPTVATLARIVGELGDNVLIGPATRLAVREAGQAAEASPCAVALLSEVMQE